MYYHKCYELVKGEREYDYNKGRSIQTTSDYARRITGSLGEDYSSFAFMPVVNIALGIYWANTYYASPERHKALKALYLERQSDTNKDILNMVQEVRQARVTKMERELDIARKELLQ
jgi:hypothetical protein